MIPVSPSQKTAMEKNDDGAKLTAGDASMSRSADTAASHAEPDEDDMQFAFRMMREFLDRLDAEIRVQPAGHLARAVALGVTHGVRAYVDQMSAIAAEKKPKPDVAGTETKTNTESLTETIKRMQQIGGIPDNAIEQLQCIRACGGDNTAYGPDHEHDCPLFRETEQRKVITCQCGDKHVCITDASSPSTTDQVSAPTVSRVDHSDRSPESAAPEKFSSEVNS